MNGPGQQRAGQANLDTFSRFSTGTRHGLRANGRISPYFEGVEADEEIISAIETSLGMQGIARGQAILAKTASIGAGRRLRYA
jgi:hypothetical protein